MAEGVVKDCENDLPGAVACFRDDFQPCIAHRRLPISHRRAIRTTNLLERLFVSVRGRGDPAPHSEARRRLKTIPVAFGEKPVLKLMFGAMIRAAERWRAIEITTFERRQVDALRKEVDHDYETENGLEGKRSAARSRIRISSKLERDRRQVWRSAICPLLSVIGSTPSMRAGSIETAHLGEDALRRSASPCPAAPPRPPPCPGSSAPRRNAREGFARQCAGTA